jgi:hypothetical protein
VTDQSQLHCGKTDYFTLCESMPCDMQFSYRLDKRRRDARFLLLSRFEFASRDSRLSATQSSFATGRGLRLGISTPVWESVLAQEL